MITKETLQEMVRKQLNEVAQDVLANVPQEQVDLLTVSEFLTNTKKLTPTGKHTL